MLCASVSALHTPCVQTSCMNGNQEWLHHKQLPGDAGWQNCHKHHCKTTRDPPAAAADDDDVERWRKPRKEP
jgi:hypothetical protein